MLAPGDHYANQINIWGGLNQLSLGLLSVDATMDTAYDDVQRWVIANYPDSTAARSYLGSIEQMRSGVSTFAAESDYFTYTLRMNRKYITLQPPGKDRPVRFKTLGKNYTPEAIRHRILYPTRRTPAGNGKKKLPSSLYAVIVEHPEKHYSGLRGLYVSYLFRVGVLPRKPRYPSYAVREDIRKLDQRIEQMEFIFEHEIEDRGQLNAIC